MAFDPSTATLAQDTKPSSSGGGFDPSTAAPVEEKPAVVGSRMHNIGRTAIETVPSATAGLVGFGAGMTAATPVAATVAPFTGPFAPVTAAAIEFGGGLAGAFVASGAAQKVTDMMHEAFAPEDYKQRQIEKQQRPYGTFAAQTLANLAGMSPKTAPEVAGKLFTKPIVQRGASAGLTASIEAGSELATEGKVDPIKVAASAASGAAMPGFNPVGKVLFGAGQAAGKAILPKKTTETTVDALPPRPDAGATPEEKAAYLDKLKAIKEERDAKAPLVEAAIRNKETGEIERMGPKHNEVRKAETKDTHEEGFVDERGNFHERQAAVDQAKRAGQIPQDHVLENPPGEREGLHSGDLRKAGDKRFELTGEQLQGVPKPPVEDTAPKSREDFKKAIEDNEYKRLELEFEAEKAASAGNEERVTSINEQIKALEAEHGKLHSDMPAVQFQDSRKPNWEELQDHLYGAKTIGEAFDRILGTKELGSLSQRILMKALNESNFVRSAKLEFYQDHLMYQDKSGNWKQNAAGLYHGGDQHLVQMGKDGDMHPLLHESIHAGTHRLLNEQGSTAAIKLQELFDKYKASHGDASYGFTDVHEFVAEAFTNKKFQKLLTDILVGQQPKGVANNLWAAFKETVRKGLGVPEGARTAFDEVMDQGVSLLKQSKDFIPRPDFEPAAPSTVPSSSGEPVEIDRTKTDPRDVKDEKEFYEIATDIFEKHGETEAVKFYEGYQEYKQTWLEPVKETEKFVGTNIKNKLANDRIIHNEMDKMSKSIPDPARREAIAEAIDKGDLSGLSPEELVVAKQYEALVKDIGDRAVEQGVVKGLLEDYVTHILDWAGAPKGAREEFIQSLLGTGKRDPAMGGMTTESKFGKERKFKTFADLEWYINDVNNRIAAAGKSDWRLKIKTKDIAEIYKEYATSMEKAIENKKLVDNLKQVRNAAGESLVKEVNKDNPMPYGWEMMNSPQFAGYAVHPDLMPALKFVFDAGPGDLMKAFGAISQITKRINVIGSFFHAKSLMEVLSSTGIPIWTPIKEVTLGGVDKLLGTKLSGITKAVDQFRSGGVGDNVDKWIKDGGLQLEVPEDVSQGILSATGKFADSMIGKYGPKTRVLEKSLSTVEKYTLGIFDKFTWDFLHTGGKLMVADAYLDRARRDAAKNGQPFDEVAQRKEISKFVNDSFGGLNWFDAATQTQNEFAKRIAMAAYNPAGRRSLQVMLFAPDWTLSTVRAFSAALPEKLNPLTWHPVEGVKGMMTPTTKADYARLYQFKTALTYLTLLNAINMMIANRPIWENKDPTRIEWPDGTSMQAMKHAMEPYHWIMDPDKTLANKLGFVPKAVIVGVGGLEYASPDAPKLVDRSAAGRLKAALGGVLPFQVSAAASAPEGEGAKRAVLGTLGFPIYGATAEQKKAARAEREKQLKEAAKRYHQKAKEKGWEK